MEKPSRLINMEMNSHFFVDNWRGIKYSLDWGKTKSSCPNSCLSLNTINHVFLCPLFVWVFYKSYRIFHFCVPALFPSIITHSVCFSSICSTDCTVILMFSSLTGNFWQPLPWTTHRVINSCVYFLCWHTFFAVWDTRWEIRSLGIFLFCFTSYF